MNGKRIAGVAGVFALAIGIAGFSAAADRPDEKSAEQSGPAASSAVRDVSIAEAGALVKSSAKLVVLDVRTPGEFAQGHIEGAVNLDFRSPDFAERLARLDPEASYLLHCKSGARSAGALAVMQQQGFGDIAHMSGGFDAWLSSGMAVTR